MKTLLLFTFCCISLFTEVAAQKIHFTDSANQWVIIESGGGTEYYVKRDVIRLDGDTSFDGHTYLKTVANAKIVQQTQGSYVGDSHISGYYFFREDTLQQTVYGRRIGDSVETVIYNAAWQLDDTAFHFSNTANHANTQYYVSSIDSVIIGGVYHKVFHFKMSGQKLGNDAIIVIEGIGCTYGPFFPVYPDPQFEYNVQLSCFHQGSTTPALSATLSSLDGGLSNHFDNANSCTLAVKDRKQIDGISVVPNLGSTTMNLKFQTPLPFAKLTIYNSFGQILAQKTFTNQANIPIGKMLSVAGNYFYKVDDIETGAIATGKLVFVGE